MAAQITKLPTPPSRTSPATFSDRADALLGALPTFVTEANALATEAETHAAEADADVATATALALAAAASANASAASASVTKWASGTYAQGACVWSPTNYMTYRCKVAGSRTTDPAADATNWEPVSSNNRLMYTVITGAGTTLAATDCGKMIEVSSASADFSIAFNACSTLGAYWYCYIANKSSYVVTLDPNSTELIDGASTVAIYPGTILLVRVSSGAGALLTNQFLSNTQPAGALIAYSNIIKRYGNWGVSDTPASSVDSWMKVAEFNLNGAYKGFKFTARLDGRTGGVSSQGHPCNIHVSANNTDVDLETPVVFFHNTTSHTSLSVKDVHVVRRSGTGTTNNVVEVWIQWGCSWMQTVPVEIEYHYNGTAPTFIATSSAALTASITAGYTTLYETNCYPGAPSPAIGDNSNQIANTAWVFDRIKLKRSARTSNTILAAADNHSFIDITSGTFSQTFTAAATLGDGWWCIIRNCGTGTITLDPNASETINGATTLAMKIGDTYLVECDGSNFNAVLLDQQVFSWNRTFFTSTDAATFTVPSGVYAIRAYVFGAGGNGSQRGGGGGGGCTYGTIPTTPGTVFTFNTSTTSTLKVSSTTYLTANHGAAASADSAGSGATAGSVGAGLNIFDSGYYAGGNGGAGSASYGGGGGGAGSPLGAGGTGGSGTNAPGGGGGMLYGGATPSASNAGGGGGTGGAGHDNAGGGSAGAATANRPGVSRHTALYTDPLLVDCTGPGGNGTASGGPGGGGGGSAAGTGGHGGFGAGGGGGVTGGTGGLGGGGGGGTTTGAGSRLAGGGGGAVTTPGNGGAAGVYIFY